MNAIDPKRLELVMEERNVDQSALARLVGCTPGAISQILTGATRRSRFLPAIARELRTTVEYLTAESNEREAGGFPVATPAAAAEQLDSVLVPYYDAPHDMGDGALFDMSVEPELIPFARRWLRGKGVSSFDQLMLLPGRGRSMEPTIHDGDVLLVDKGQLTIEQHDQIWAFGYAGAGMIKRLRPDADGQITVTSDNEKVAKAFRALPADIQIVGRVAAVLKWES